MMSNRRWLMAVFSVLMSAAPFVTPGAAPAMEGVTAANLAAIAPRGGKSGPQVGSASYYHDSLAGRKTANGERYNPRAMTAAHRTLPFGTRLKVTNLANGRSVFVTVNDRGPYAKGRILDLSRAAAEKLGFIKQGHTRVRIEVA